MKKSKAILAALLSLVMVAAFAACAPTQTAGGNDGGTSTSTPAATGGSEAAGTSEATGGSDNIVISFWKWIPTEGLQTDDLVAKWNELHPEITLDILHIGESESYFQKLSAALPSGEGPSVIAMQPGARANQYKEFCEPLAPYAEERWGSDWEDKFLDTALEQCRWSGEDYTILPGGMTATPVILYNATVFEENGIETPDTMDDVYAAIETLKADSNIIPGVGIGAKEGWTCRDVFMGIVNQVSPGKIYDAQDGTASFEDPAIVEAMTIWKNLFDTGFFAEGSLGVGLYPDINDNFNHAGDDGSRYYVMENAGTWHGSSMTAISYADGLEQGTRGENMHIGAFTLPAVKEGAEKNMVATVDIAWGINKDKSEEEKKAAFEFIAFMAAEEGQEIWSNTLQVLPCAKGIDLSNVLASLDGPAAEAGVEMFQHYVENAIGAREFRYSEIANAMNDVLPAVAGGTMTPEDACKTLQQASESVAR